jgi:hypothetical protein
MLDLNNIDPDKIEAKFGATCSPICTGEEQPFFKLPKFGEKQILKLNF